MKEPMIKAEPGDSTATTTFEFDAPVERVFRAYTDPELVPLGWGSESRVRGKRFYDSGILFPVIPGVGPSDCERRR